MTPEEHIEMAEKIIDNYRNDRDAVAAAAVHVAIANHKKQFPPDAGRPIPADRAPMISADGQPFSPNPWS
jgi:hypothetical protein